MKDGSLFSQDSMDDPSIVKYSYGKRHFTKGGGGRGSSKADYRARLSQDQERRVKLNESTRITVESALQTEEIGDWEAWVHMSKEEALSLASEAQELIPSWMDIKRSDC
jgi:hypothetical protein